MRRWGLVFIFLGWLAMTPALAAPPSDFGGRWALRAGGRVVLVLALTPAPDGAGFTGELVRPARLMIQTGPLTIRHVGGPVKSWPLVRSSLEDGALSLAFRNPDDPSEARALVLRRTGAETLGLSFEGAPLPPLTLTRVGADVRPAGDWDANAAYRLEEAEADNAEMTRLFDADQADRRGDIAHIDWIRVTPADAERRAATRRLLEAGALSTGADYLHAAGVFQHGDRPADFLLAHTLAMVALGKGRADASWLAAATLDRYLQSIGQPQVYGTQYRTPSGAPVTQEPYDRNLVSDALRAELGVPPLAQQQVQRDAYQADAQKR